MAKQEKTTERTYCIPLRKEFLKVPRWKRTKKAVKAVREFLRKHLKGEVVKLSEQLNNALWKQGLKKPPHHIKVTAFKDEKGIIRAELFGYSIKTQEKRAGSSSLEKVTEQLSSKKEGKIKEDQRERQNNQEENSKERDIFIQKEGKEVDQEKNKRENKEEGK